MCEYAVWKEYCEEASASSRKFDGLKSVTFGMPSSISRLQWDTRSLDRTGEAQVMEGDVSMCMSLLERIRTDRGDESEVDLVYRLRDH